MVIVGVRFKDVGKVYYFDPDKFTEGELSQGTAVIVETGRGAEYGIIALEKRDCDVRGLTQPIRKVLRIASPEDTQQEIANLKREEEAKEICLDKIKAHKLEMHLVDVELTFDLSKVIFFFTADGRVDFRELVKDLAATFRMRIELRQIGVRDEAKMLSGIGICGRVLCCSSFLDEFQPVSIKSAKDQGLSLNPTKISGICGKLMCCLKYEEETYAHLLKGMPGVGDLVRTPNGDGDVLSINILRQTAKIAVRAKNGDDPVTDVYSVSDIKILEHRPQCERNCNCPKCKKDNEK
ncbi:MAG: stage 0 sporulation family protein [Clostridiales bacterium]|jgi:cell fate regulator YaaT (PSP1 superfamily)|nr:stage 0 sporulation family protein [Clostridiales bacterium]